MAPQRAPSIERTDEYEDFIKRLQDFHDKRGTILEPEPRIGNKPVDLLRLYKRVVEDGGYDIVSDTRQVKLGWRTIGQDFSLGNATLPTLAFTLKTIYYKNLAAFEIADVHKQEPPPKEILEEVSAKGANLLGRTVENYKGPGNRLSNAVDGEDQEMEAQENGTPKNDEMEVDGAGGSGTRTRGLRPAPPQRQLFQSDISVQRQSRQQQGQTNSPTPTTNLHASTNGTYGTGSAAQALANYEPKQHLPLTLRPVLTPSNNADEFKKFQNNVRKSQLAKTSKQPSESKSSLMLPGTGFPGPNIYIRTVMSLKSAIPEEQEFALHHLVKISLERGDKYRFDSFSGLAECLIDKVLEASSIFYDVSWRISYDGLDHAEDFEVLDGLNGTSDIIERIHSAPLNLARDRMESMEMGRRMKLINEAGLVLRNMSMLEENAIYLSKNPALFDSLTILLTLPNDAVVTELKQYGYEIAEQVLKYVSIDTHQPLLQVLVSSFKSPDRGVILTSLRAVSRIGIHLQQITPLPSVPIDIIERLCEWLLIEDRDLRAACLDFLYRFTAGVENVDALVKNIDLDVFVKLLIRLLQHGARTEEVQENGAPARTPQTRPSAETMPIPKIPQELVENLLTYEEPERSSQWLRTCFEEDTVGEITQIALWQAYQIPFTPYSAQRPLLPAKDFITNVSNTFSHASAQVINHVSPQKFIIKGIRPREVPIDPKGRVYMRCKWQIEGGECQEYAREPQLMWEHVVKDHLKVVRDSDGQWDFTPVDTAEYKCRWADCSKFDKSGGSVSPFTVGIHIKTHLPDASNMAYQRSKHNKSVEEEEALHARTQAWSMRNTIIDERNEATGLPLTSVMILRNLTRNIPKTPTGVNRGGRKAVQDLFAPFKHDLYYALAYNRSLGSQLHSLTKAIDPEET